MRDPPAHCAAAREDVVDSAGRPLLRGIGVPMGGLKRAATAPVRSLMVSAPASCAIIARPMPQPRLDYRCAPGDRSRGRRARAIASWLLAFGTLLCLLVACDPYSEARSGMSEAERARFARGLQLATPCWNCHDLTGSAVKVGPPLVGFFGRPIASVAGFKYSDAFRRAGLVWDARTLDAFLANVPGFIPGNKMVSPSVVDRRARADLVFFLEHATGRTPDS